MIFDQNNKKVSKRTYINEKELQLIIINNFNILFPKYRLLKSEFILRGDVRQFGTSGRIDILAFDSKNT